MSFLAPLFFVGLAAIAIPVLIHLIQRERKEVVYVPSLMFLRKIPYQSVQRRRVHNWLLLLLRVALPVIGPRSAPDACAFRPVPPHPLRSTTPRRIRTSSSAPPAPTAVKNAQHHWQRGQR